MTRRTRMILPEDILKWWMENYYRGGSDGLTMEEFISRHAGMYSELGHPDFTPQGWPWNKKPKCPFCGSEDHSPICSPDWDKEVDCWVSWYQCEGCKKRYYWWSIPMERTKKRLMVD
jgi:hypothetical protein